MVQVPAIGNYWFDRCDPSLAALLIDELKAEKAPHWQIVKVVSQWADYQRRILATDEKESTHPQKCYSKTFVAKYLGYEDDERMVDDGVMGVKTKILIEGKAFKTGKPETQSIATGFFEYNLSNRSNFLFELAQANAIREKVKNTPEGATVLIRKVVWEEESRGGEPLRYASDFVVLNDGGGGKAKGNRRAEKVSINDVAKDLNVDPDDLLDYLEEGEDDELLAHAKKSLDDAEDFLEGIGYFQ